MRKPLLVVVALVAALLIGVGMPLYATETENGQDTCWNGAPEGTKAQVDGWSWWPLGTRCVLIDADGSRQEKTVPPWRGDPDWTANT